MCFSATASFGASAVISVIGAGSFVKAKDTGQKSLACIPLFFGLQQFVEGLVWLSVSNINLVQLHDAATYAFLAFARVIWPGMIPLVAFLSERDGKNKRILSAFLALGFLISLLNLYFLSNYPVHSTVGQHHINYDIDLPYALLHASDVFYFLTAVLPLFLSSTKSLRWLGFSIAVAYVIARIFYHLYVTSVWCFFAAVLSIIIFVGIVQTNKKKEELAQNANIYH